MRLQPPSHTFRVMLRHPQPFDPYCTVNASRYEFHVRGRLGDGTLASFDGFESEVKPAETILRGDVADQSALHGVLERIQALGLELVEVRQVADPSR